ncbi:unnamed protein product [Camellia sinensis]
MSNLNPSHRHLCHLFVTASVGGFDNTDPRKCREMNIVLQIQPQPHVIVIVQLEGPHLSAAAIGRTAHCDDASKMQSQSPIAMAYNLSIKEWDSKPRPPCHDIEKIFSTTKEVPQPTKEARI